jgi:hypothetical protein
MSYTKPDFELADIAREFGEELLGKYNLTGNQKKVLTCICQCRTAELGGHKEQCNNPDCNHERYAYNGCRNRHCPKCNGLKREKWVLDRKADALPVPYFHIVFTIPDSLESQCLSHGKEMYNLLFKSAWDTLQFFASKHNHLGAEIGMTCVLHTWGQNLSRHTHLHCLVPAGGVTVQKKWRAAKGDGKFFVHVKLLSKVFRGKFTDGLIALQNQGVIQLVEEIKNGFKYHHPLYKKNWVVYAKKPLPTSDKVVEYIGRYSHRIAISNHRIKDVKDGVVTFSWLNYHTGKTGLMPLNATDFLHRFILHVLPASFIKIRHYGILSTRNKTECITLVRNLFDVPMIAKIQKGKSWMDIFESVYGRHPKLCHCCNKGMMIAMESYLPKYLLRNKDDPDLMPNTGFYLQHP